MKISSKIALAVLLLVFGCKRNQVSSEAQTSPKQSPKGNSGPALVRKTEPEEMLYRTRKRLMDEIIRVTDLERGMHITARQWKLLIDNYWMPEFDKPAIFGPTSVLPTAKTMLTIVDAKESFEKQLATGEFVNITSEKEKEAVMAIHLFAMADAADGGHALPGALAGRLEISSPAVGDIYLFKIFNDAFVEVGHKRPIAAVELPAWRRVAESPNPLYRLLALRTFFKVSTDVSQRIDFLKNFINEKDQSIIAELIDSAVYTSTPDAANLLAVLQANLGDSVPLELTDRINRSRTWLESLPKETAPSQ